MVGETTGLEPEALQKLRFDMARLGALRDTPYPPYALQITGAEIRRVRTRIDRVREAEAAEHVEEEHEACQLIEDPDDNRARLIFEGKPPAEVRTLLKRSDFRWSL
jgi:hypothetical protein